MATLYVKSAGGNASAAGTWSNVNSAGVDNSGPPTSADDCIAELGSGQLTIDAATSMKSFSATGGTGNYTGTLTHNAFVWTVAGSLTFSSGMTYTLANSASSALAINATGTLTSAAKTFGDLTFSVGTITAGDNIITGGSTITLSSGTFVPNGKTFTSNRNGTSSIVGNFTFYNFTRTAGAASNGMNFASDLTITNNLTLTGSSSILRLLVSTNSLGTTRTITNTGATMTWQNVDFRDIALTTNYDASAISGNSGDCGGNSGITFTTAATQTATGNSANWSTATWSGRVPLPQDDVVLSLTAGQTLTNDMPRIGKSISATTALNFTTGVAVTSYGSIDLTNINTFTQSSTWILEGRGTHTITSAGKSFAATLSLLGVGSTYSLSDAFTSTSQLGIGRGTFNTNNFSVSVSFVSVNITGVSSPILNLGSSTITLTRNSSSVWEMNPVGTLNAGTSTILISDTGASSKTFSGFGQTYNNLSITGGGTGPVIITGANTFNRITVNGGTKSITLPGSTTTTILSGQGLNNGTNLVTFTASAGSATVSKAAGKLKWNYVSLTNIPSTGGAVFYAGANSTNGGGNTGWIFRNAPSTSGTVLGGIPIPL